MTARHWPATTTRHHRPDTGPWLPRTELRGRWTAFAGVACLVIRYAIALSKGARR